MNGYSGNVFRVDPDGVRNWVGNFVLRQELDEHARNAIRRGDFGLAVVGTMAGTPIDRVFVPPTRDLEHAK